MKRRSKLNRWIRARLKESSTWRGAIAVAGGLAALYAAWAGGHSPSEIVAATVAATGLVNIVRKEPGNEPIA